MKKRRLRKLLPVILIVAVLIIGLRSLLFASYVVDGESMQPTLHDGNLLMVNKVIYDLTQAERFDVIVFHANEEDDYVKRVVGLPGDKISYRDDKLHVNDEYVEEPFLEPYVRASDSKPYTADFTLEEKTGEKEVPEGKLFVLGDNRQDSLDSRSFGFISQDQLVGKVDIKYWPLNKTSISLGK
ncbi:signal peptidase I [Oceanobacillus manasiensis]|uniref:signal peptidase I n=1 Tax=Oceanobacillus manasiensis TaxID=586413 RepID=UPI0005A66B48|nr:signal peptidase I [Oceanobacillus manasiensis]